VAGMLRRMRSSRRLGRAAVTDSGNAVTDSRNAEEFDELCSAIERQLGKKISARKRAYALALIETDGHKTDAMRMIDPDCPSPQQRGFDMFRDDAVLLLVTAVKASKVTTDDIDKDFVTRLMLSEIVAPDAKARDRGKMVEALARTKGMLRESVDHRHMHIHRTDTEFLTDLRNTLGLEAARRAATDLGYSEADIDGVLADDDQGADVQPDP